MKYRIIALLLVLAGLMPRLYADEGMWLPIFIESLNYTEMKQMGLQLTPEEIYRANHSSLKDAIAIFGRGCTSEVISDQGLLLTNHHCGYSSIQEHSSLEHNYLKDGFWAMSFEEELPTPGLTATFLIRIEDVTEKIVPNLPENISEQERNEKIRELARDIEAEATEGTHYKAMVRSFFEGNEFYLFVYEVYEDVRLVGAPPSSIGKFGADTDNWMWPRHTGDFSLFRVYMSPDGKPAPYSKENIPFKPRHHLPISMSGYQIGDFAMILGYPGSTQRYMTSYGVQMALDVSNQTIVDIRDRKLKIMMEDMQADEAVRIQYASKYARVSNYWKYFIGQTKGLKRLHVYDKKKGLEDEFTRWANNNSSNPDYREALPLIAEAYQTIRKYEKARIYFREAIRSGAEIMGTAMQFERLFNELAADNPDQKRIDGLINRFKERLPDYFKDYNAPTDEKLLAAMLGMYYRNVDPEQQPDELKAIYKKYKGDFSSYARKVFEKSIFADQARIESFLNSPSAKQLSKDPVFKLASAFQKFYNENISAPVRPAYEKLSRGNRFFIAGLREMQPRKKFYPDANFTMRLTYGQILDYYPADAVHYDYYTTLKGVMEKEDPDNWEFVVPDKLKELYNKKDYGIYSPDGEMKVCFISNLDITGGNSGSPVINGKGELIGLAFDGNWEAMSGDIVFEPEIQRTISVDIRYVLFIIDKFAGATRLIEEMDLAYSRPAPKEKLIQESEPVPADTGR